MAISILLLLVAGVVAFYLYLTWHFSHFEKLGIPFVKPYPLAGGMGPMMRKKKNMAHLLEDVYKHCAGSRLGGFFQFRTPIIILHDPELIKAVCVKDFDHFVDHGESISEDMDTLFGKNMFALTGKKWREMRPMLSPAFTTSKMKSMLSLVSECGVQLREYLEMKITQHQAAGEGETFSLEMKDLFTRFTNDVIATAAFGISVDSLKEPDNEFYVMGKDSSTFSNKKKLMVMCYMMFPRLSKLLSLEIFEEKVKNFFRSLVHDTIAIREKEGIFRPDMIHLLMQARKGELKAEAGEEENSTLFPKESKTQWCDDDITAQALIFFIAGFDSSSTLLCFVAHLLAVHPEVQERLQEEIDNVLEENGNKLTYEGLQKMKYLDMVLSETLRLYPPASFTDRCCTKPYTIPATDRNPEVTIRKGDRLWLPIYALHHDPEHFPDPERFDPERFSEENKHSIKPFTYIPFGVGPRNCVGMRFALMEAKVCLVHILTHLNLTVVGKTQVPLQLTKKDFTMSVDDGFWVGFERRR